MSVLAQKRNESRKCDHCGEWNEGTPEFCQFCGEYTNADHKRAAEKQTRKEEKKAADKAIFDSKPRIVRVFLRAWEILELTFVSIVSFFAWLIFWIAG